MYSIYYHFNLQFKFKIQFITGYENDMQVFSSNMLLQHMLPNTQLISEKQNINSYCWSEATTIICFT